jgi:hypothetical protein
MSTNQAVKRHSATTITLGEPIDLTKLPPAGLLNDKEAAAALSVTPGTLGVWRSTGRYQLPFVKIGRLTKYRVKDLLDFIERRTRTSGATE